MDRWLTNSVWNRLRLTTYESYSAQTRKHIAPALGHTKLKALTPIHLQSFYGSKLGSGLSKRWVEYLYTLLHAALKQAAKWELVPRDVADAVDQPRPDKKERPICTLKQARLFLEAASEDGFEALLYFCENDDWYKELERFLALRQGWEAKTNTLALEGLFRVPDIWHLYPSASPTASAASLPMPGSMCE